MLSPVIRAVGLIKPTCVTVFHVQLIPPPLFSVGSSAPLTVENVIYTDAIFSITTNMRLFILSTLCTFWLRRKGGKITTVIFTNLFLDIRIVFSPIPHPPVIGHDVNPVISCEIISFSGHGAGC